jgi:predicted Zn-dependent protease
MSELKGEKVCRLHRMGISQVHEVSIESSSPPTVEIRYPQNLRSGKKNLRRFVLKIKKQNPGSDVEVWSMDEHRI